MLNLDLQQIAIDQCRHGIMAWPRADDTIGRALALYGEFSEEENTLMRRYVSCGDTVIDVGANLGTTVLPLARVVGDQGRVIAFEPQPLMAQCLQTTLTLNEIFHVTLLTAAAGRHSGWGRIPAKRIDDVGNFGGVTLAETGLPIPVLRLDDLAVEACALLKIDVEGMEWEVLQGAQETLLRHQPALYLEAFPRPSTVACLEWLLEHGWSCFWHFTRFYSERNFRNNTDNIFGNLGDLNVLALPATQTRYPALPRLQSALEDWQAAYIRYFHGA